MFLSTHQTFFCKFLIVCTSLLTKNWWQTSVQAWNTLFHLPLVWIASKNYFCEIRIIFVINQYQTMQSLILAERFAFFIGWPSCIYIYIYIYNHYYHITQNTPAAPLQRVTPPPNECLRYDTKQCDGEVPVILGLWGMRSTTSLPFLPGPLWHGIVDLSIGK